MKSPHRFMICLMVFSLIVVGCCCKHVEEQPKVEVPVEMMKVGFCYPVVAVNGQNANVSPYLSCIEMEFPTNSTQDLELTVIDSEEKEHTLYGTIKVLDYTQYTKANDLIIVSPTAEDPVEVYNRILKTGYGAFIVHESITDPDGNIVQGDVLLRIALGTKKKDNQIAFYFPQGKLEKVDGSDAPIALLVDPNTQHELLFSMDERLYQCYLEVYDKNYYTTIAPVTIIFGEKEQRCLRSKDGVLKLAVYVPSKKEREKGGYPFMTVKDPIKEAKERGVIVAFLTVKHIIDDNEPIFQISGM